MPMSVMCPHCFEVNPLPRDGAVYCMKCHHRADVSPASCDCLNCKPPPWMPELPPPPNVVAMLNSIPGITVFPLPWPDAAELPPTLPDLDMLTFEPTTPPARERPVQTEMKSQPAWIESEDPQPTVRVACDAECFFIKLHADDGSEGWFFELCWRHDQLIEFVEVMLPFMPDADVSRLAKLIEYRQS